MRRAILTGLGLAALLAQGCCGGLFDRMCERHQDRCSRNCDRYRERDRDRCYEPSPCDDDAPVYRPSRPNEDRDRRPADIDPPPRYYNGGR